MIHCGIRQGLLNTEAQYVMGRKQTCDIITDHICQVKELKSIIAWKYDSTNA